VQKEPSFLIHTKYSAKSQRVITRGDRGTTRMYLLILYHARSPGPGQTGDAYRSLFVRGGSCCRVRWGEGNESVAAGMSLFPVWAATLRPGETSAFVCASPTPAGSQGCVAAGSVHADPAGRDASGRPNASALCTRTSRGRELLSESTRPSGALLKFAPF
jgi:hypothetical protein